jgi:hypothetical protein
VRQNLKFSRFMKAFLLLTLGFFSTFPAQALQPGDTGAVELKIPVGARPIAMGQAFVAVADDANAVYWNPAGLAQLGGSQVTVQYDVFIETITYFTGAAGFKLGNDMAAGLMVKMLSSGSEPEYDNMGIPTGNTFSLSYMDIDLAAAYRLSYSFNIGLNLKYISKSLAGTSATTFAADLGLMYKTPIPHLTAGLNVQNVGLPLKFDTVADPLPMNIKVGVAYKMFEDNFTLAYDMNFPNDNAISANLGGEYWYKDTLVGRFGYQFQGAIDQNQVGIGAKAGLYLGGGIKITAFKTNIGLDYAWTNDGFLGSNHHFALDWYF